MQRHAAALLAAWFVLGGLLRAQDGLEPAQEALVLGLYEAFEASEALPPEAARPGGEFEKVFAALDGYVIGGYPGGQEELTVATDLADRLRELAPGHKLDARRTDFLDLERAAMRMRLCRLEEAASIVAQALQHPSHLEREFELALLAGQVALYRRDARAPDHLQHAAALLERVTDRALRRDFELQWCLISARLAILLGLPERGSEPIERARRLATEQLALTGSRARLDLVWLMRVALLHALLQHERVLELLAAPDADLPEPGTAARVQLDVREAVSRIELERHGQRPADAQAREPVALLRGALASGALDRLDEALARAWLTRAYLDRGEIERATEALAALESRSGGGDDCGPRWSEPSAALRLRIELARPGGERTRELLEFARHEWERSLERQRDLSATAEISGPLHLQEAMELAVALARLELASGKETAAESALQELALYQVGGSLARAFEAGPVPLERVRTELLEEGELALVPFAAREDGLLFVVQRGGVRAFELPSLFLLQSARRRLDEALARALPVADGPPWDEVERRAAELGQLLLPDELRRALRDARRLTIVAGENLGYVPFELLPGPDGKPIGQLLPVRYLPSFPVAAALSARRNARGARADTLDFGLLCADMPGALPAAELEPLQVPAGELEALLGRYEAGHQRLLRGKDADRAGLVGLLGAQPRILQLLVHGHYDGALLRPARLVLAGEPAALASDHVERLPSAPLVILTACRAWQGPRRRGDDGRAHLPGAFLLAGADTVLAPAVPLLLEDALKASAVLHRELASRRAPAEAAFAMRKELAAGSGARTRSAALLLHVIGLGDRPLLP